jgi:CelD/BcsL family acetyltransferase involved in cellulose biosynthesis
VYHVKSRQVIDGDRTPPNNQEVAMPCTAPCSSLEILDQAALPRLEDDWEELLERSYDNRIFLTPTWQRLWWEYFGSGTLHFLALRDEEDGLQALLPLQLLRRERERVLTLMGDHNLADYMDGLAVRQHAQRLLGELWKCALARLEWDRVELRHVPSASPLIPALQAAASECGFEMEVQEDEVSPVAILCNNWEGYLQMLSKKQRHEIRRKLRRALDGAEWEWRTVETVSELERDLPIFFRLHEASAREKARFMTEEVRAFFRAMSATFLQRGWLRLSILKRDGQDVAANMSFSYRNRYLLYNSGYDPAAAAYSPGIAAIALTMQDAIAERAVAFDFLSGNEPYKYQFGASDTHTCRIGVRP